MAWKKLCSATDVPVNQLKRLTVDGIAVVVTNLGDEFVAFPPLCPHMAEPLEVSGICDGETLTCTKHLWQWDLRTGTEQGAAEKPLLRYLVRRDGDAVLIDIDRELTYDYDE